MGAAWCPADGVLNPFKFVLAVAQAFKRLGGVILDHNPVTGITVHESGSYTVHTGQCDIATGKLINCTGAYAEPIGDMLWVDIPVVPLARE